MGFHIASSTFRAHAFCRLIACGLIIPLLTVSAQGQVVIGGGSPAPTANRGYNLSVQSDPNGSVTVDWSVLDTLGANARTSNGAAPAAPLVLSPPRSQPQPRHRTATAAPAKRTPRPAAPAPTPQASALAPAPAASPPAAPTPLAPATSSPSDRAVTSVPDLPPPPPAAPAPPAATPIPSDSNGPAVAQAPARTPLPPDLPQLAPPPAPPAAVMSPAPTREPPSAPQAVASLPPSTAPTGSPAANTSALSIAFKADSSALPDDAKSRLDGIVRTMTANDRMRAQIIAYAAGTNDTASQARRLSLSRALAVRSYLIEKGVASTRLDVRALGHQVESGSPDRVDIALAAR
jgi:outer membrane protein OmpA-like peptidoglycan-associated protein